MLHVVFAVVVGVLWGYDHHGNGDPPPAFATTSTETIDYSIGFGFAALIYVSL
jgi:hypothetical protein